MYVGILVFISNDLGKFRDVWLEVNRGDSFKQLISQYPDFKNCDFNYVVWNEKSIPAKELISNEHFLELYRSSVRPKFGVTKMSLIEFKPIADSYRNALIDYVKVGKALFRHSLYNDVLDVIDAAWGDAIKLVSTHIPSYESKLCPPFNTPFLSLLAPSMSGKTELAVALDNYSEFPLESFGPDDETQPRRPPRLRAVIRLIVGSTETRHQNIYESVRSFSLAFLHALRHDAKLLMSIIKCDPNAPESENCRKVINECLVASDLCKITEKFRTVGIIVRLVKARLEKTDKSCLSEALSLDYESLTIFEGRTEIVKLAGKTPIVFALDEFNLGSSGKDLQLYMLLARNIIRELGLIALLLGTDSAAANLVLKEGIGGSFSRGRKIPWCYLISKLPGATPETLVMTGLTKFQNRFTSNDEFCKFYTWISGTCPSGQFYSVCQNPGILRLFVRICRKTLSESRKKSLTCAQLFDGAFERIGRVLHAKKITIQFSTAQIATGQYLLISPQQRQQDGRKNPSYLMHRHFAYLDLNEARNFRYHGRELEGVHVLYRPDSSKVEDFDDSIEDSSGPLPHLPLEIGDDVDEDSEGSDITDLTEYTDESSDDDSAGRPIEEDPGLRVGQTFGSDSIEDLSKKPEFQPDFLFPEFSRNELLYMALLDNRTMLRFTGCLTFATIAKYGHVQTGCKSDGNGNATINRRRNGSYLENAVQGAAVLSTHRSISGVTFGRFFKTFLANLGTAWKSISMAVPEALESMWDNLVVPYTVGVGTDAQCSEAFQSMPGTFTGVFKQVPDKERYDGCLIPWFLWKITEHCKSCATCSNYNFAALMGYLDNPRAVEVHICRGLAEALAGWVRKGLLGPVHLNNMAACLLEMKDHEDGLDASALVEILKRFVRKLDAETPLNALKHQICILVTAKCNIARAAKLDEAISLFKGSIYLLQGPYPSLSFECLNYDDSSKRVCFIIPGEDALDADFDPFKHFQSSISFNAKRNAEVPQEDMRKRQKSTREVTENHNK